jgi:protein subunit release factor B
MLARGRSCSTLTEKGVPSSFDHATRYAILLKLNMFHLIVVLLKKNQGKKEELKKKEEPKKKDVKKIKEVVASVKTKEQKPPVKTKKMTKPENKPVPKMVRKWVPKIATPAKSVDPK